jgi:hypothetical protein
MYFFSAFIVLFGTVAIHLLEKETFPTYFDAFGGP